ncbi:MAG: galactokinase [Planctomycetota bacterium]
MQNPDAKTHCQSCFAERYGDTPVVTASAPGRLEILGNHTDYNAGLTLSCAVGFRCYASIRLIDEPVVRLSSTAFVDEPKLYPLNRLHSAAADWTAYLLGLVRVLQLRGHVVPGFSMLIDSEVPASAGLSSSSAMEMAALTALVEAIKIQLHPLDLAEIGQQTEVQIVGAQTGLLDPLSVLLGQADHLLGIDFQNLSTELYAMPPGWCFVAVDSGVKHDLTHEYNDRRSVCEAAAVAMGRPSLREVDFDCLYAHGSEMGEEAWRCARHVLTENDRVRLAKRALEQGDVARIGRLMFESHTSSRDDFRNSCDELDVLIDYARQDDRCVGARLSGGGFGGITIHLVREADASGYLGDLLGWCEDTWQEARWGKVCRIDQGARVERC